MTLPFPSQSMNYLLTVPSVFMTGELVDYSVVDILTVCSVQSLFVL
jgi:predicted thioredoxin/glutaredoxin